MSNHECGTSKVLIPADWGRDVAAKVAKSIREAVRAYSDAHSDADFDHIEEACDKAVDAAMAALAAAFVCPENYGLDAALRGVPSCFTPQQYVHELRQQALENDPPTSAWCSARADQIEADLARLSDSARRAKREGEMKKEDAA